MMKLFAIASLFLCFNATAQQRTLTDNTLVTVADVGTVLKTIRKPGTDSVFALKVFGNDTTWNFRFVIPSKLSQLANDAGLITQTQASTLFQPIGGVTVNQATLPADVTNSSAVANTAQDVTGLSFAVLPATTYRFRFFVTYTAAATTTGSRWLIATPASTILNYRSEYSLTAAARTFNEGLTAQPLPTAANASSTSTLGNIAVVEGIIRPSVAGVVQLRFASEVASSAVVAKGGASWVEWEVL